MRILHINAGNMYGGVETLLVTLARCRNFCPEMEPSFAICFEGRLSRELQETGAPVSFLGEVRTSRFWSVMKSRHRLRALLAKENFDVVVTHMPWSHAIFGPEVRRAHLTLVNWVHSVSNGTHWVERWARRTPPDLALCNSQLTASLAPRLFAHTPTEFVYMPVAPVAAHGVDRSAIRRELGASEETVVILQASRMESWKGHKQHLRALSRLKDQRDFVCWIAGGAQSPDEQIYVAELRQLAQGLGIADRVQFLGHRGDIPRLMAAADIFCQPNQEPEPFGIVFVEALLGGLPVVTTRVGGASEIVDETCGVFSGNESAELASVLDLLIRDRDLRQKLGGGGPIRAESLCHPASQLQKLHFAFDRIRHAALHPLTSRAEAARAS